MIDIEKHMRFVKSAADLQELRDVLLKSKEYNSEKVFVCAGGGCIASGSMKVKEIGRASCRERV